MDEGVYEVIEVKPSERREDKDVVLLEGGLRGFLADAGKYAVGDSVVIEEYVDYRGEQSYRAVE